MNGIRIKYATKAGNHYEHITHVGDDTRTWPVEHVILWIELKVATFYVEENGKRAYVAVVKGVRRKYLQTHADGVWQNNLLSLPPCRLRAA